MADQRIQQKIDATVTPGDGIGPDIVASTVDMLAALGSPFVWDRQQRGLAGIESSGDQLPAAMLDSIRCTRLAGSLVTSRCAATPQARVITATRRRRVGLAQPSPAAAG